jgi:hypothetical protein
MPPGSSERIAEQALTEALLRLCRGGGWEGLARELAWRSVVDGGRDPRRIDAFSESAAAMLASLIDEALWQVERVVLEGWEAFLEDRPGDAPGALAAVRLDAAEEAARLVATAYERVLEALLAGVPLAA